MNPPLLLSVSLLPALDPVTAQTPLAVVIDVLRATSAMTVAMQQGVRHLHTCRDVATAWSLRERHRGDRPPLLCGERGCRPIEGFDLGNSPAEYETDTLRGRDVVFTTTNGTAAIAAAAPAGELILASFLNLSGVVDRIAGCDRVHLVCAGTEGQVTCEDTLLAGAIIARVSRCRSTRLVGDGARMAAALWRHGFGADRLPEVDALAAALRDSAGGANLIRVGYEADLRRCARIDGCDVVPTRDLIGTDWTRFCS